MEFNISMMLNWSRFSVILIATFIFFAKDVTAEVKFSEGYEAAQQGNFSKAISIWQPLAEQGDADAQYTLAWMFESGKGVKADLDKAIYWYKKSSQQGNLAAQYVLATLYEKGAGVTQNSNEAFSYYMLAAKQGDPTSQYQIGYYFQHAIGTAQNNQQSLIWYNKAAQQGHINSQIALGELYQTGQGVEVDYKKSTEWYQKAATQHNAIAQYHLASLHEQGLGVKQDYGKAIALYKSSASSNYSPSAYKLGLIYEKGQGVDIDFDQAIIWFQQAALQGDTDAQLKLGHLAEQGNGTEKDIQKAIEWYQQASRRDRAEAYYLLAQIYEKGTTDFPRNIPVNLGKAFQNYQYASALDYPLAHAKLAYFYETGLLVKTNKAEAIALYKRAEQPWAKKRLAKLLSHQDCLDTATTMLFSKQMRCADRKSLRREIKKQSIKVITEDNTLWSDTYFTGAKVKGTSELNISYTADDQFAQATYTFVGRNNPELIVNVKQQFIKDYGQPTTTQGDSATGPASFEWQLPDQISLKVYREWPDTTTYVKYTYPEHYHLQQKQQAKSMNKPLIMN
jgi:TPR repeat protein